MKEILEALDKAMQLADVAQDWHLEEVEINGEMVSTFELREEFHVLSILLKGGEYSSTDPRGLWHPIRLAYLPCKPAHTLQIEERRLSVKCGGEYPHTDTVTTFDLPGLVAVCRWVDGVEEEVGL